MNTNHSNPTRITHSQFVLDIEAAVNVTANRIFVHNVSAANSHFSLPTSGLIVSFRMLQAPLLTGPCDDVGADYRMCDNHQQTRDNRLGNYSRHENSYKLRPNPKGAYEPTPQVRAAIQALVGQPGEGSDQSERGVSG